MITNPQAHALRSVFWRRSTVTTCFNSSRALAAARLTTVPLHAAGLQGAKSLSYGVSTLACAHASRGATMADTVGSQWTSLQTVRMQLAFHRSSHVSAVPTPALAWQSSAELTLDITLPTGQSFRWQQTGVSEYTGVLGTRLVCLRQDEQDVWYRVLARAPGTDPAFDALAIREYFNLPGEDAAGSAVGVELAQLSAQWRTKCSRFDTIYPYFKGARMLRQDPVECLFSFICSSNNHISRIHGMVERLCAAHGTPLIPEAPASCCVKSEPGMPLLTELSEGACIQTAAPTTPGAPAKPPAPARGRRHSVEVKQEVCDSLDDNAVAAVTGSQKQRQQQQQEVPASQQPGVAVTPAPGMPTEGTAEAVAYYAFPTLEQLAGATEEELRAAGFGYRAKFIVGSVALLQAKPEGGREWLLGLRSAMYEEAIEQLTTLPGVGPKVAACVALFCLDKHAAIPVDTHVWQIACTHYLPALRGKTPTPKLHPMVQQAFVDRFGPYAGWAHNALFVSELAQQQHRLPEHLRKGGSTGVGSKRRGKRDATPEASDSSDETPCEVIREDGVSSAEEEDAISAAKRTGKAASGRGGARKARKA